MHCDQDAAAVRGCCTIGSRGRRSTAFYRIIFTGTSIFADVVTITGSSLVAGIAYHTLYYHIGGMFETFAALGLSVSVLFVTFNSLRDEYAVSAYLNFGANCRRAVFVWNTTFVTTLVVFFVTKESAEFSRAAMTLFYLIGLVSLVMLRCTLVYYVKANASTGKISALRVVLVGEETELQDFIGRHKPWTVGIDVVASAVLRGEETLKDDLALAAASARVLRPDDIFIMLPWSRTHAIDACVEAFTQVPRRSISGRSASSTGSPRPGSPASVRSPASTSCGAR